MARTGLSAVLFLRLNLLPGSAGDGAEPSVAASSVSGVRAGSSEGISVTSVKPEFSLFSVNRIAVSVAESDSALSITKRAASASSGSSMVMVTSASPSGGRLVVPLKMQSAMRSARSDLWLCSPRTQEMASTTLDLPQPFGPTMQVVPDPLNVTTVRSQNDLKPTISTFRSFSKMSPFGRQLLRGCRHKIRNQMDNSEPSHCLWLRRKGAKRDDVSFLEGRVFGTTGQPYTGRLSKRLAGSQSEAQPPGARMAVRKKTLTRCATRVKACATTCGRFANATSDLCNARVVLSLSGCRRSFLEVLVVPGEDAVQAIQE